MYHSFNPLRAKDVYLRPGCTLLSAELISFCRPKTYIYVLKVFRIRPRVLHSVGQGRIYTSIYAARSQRRIYTSFLYSFLKSFGLKNVKGLASEIHFQITLKIMPQGLMLSGLIKFKKHVQTFFFKMASVINTSNLKYLTVEVIEGVLQMQIQLMKQLHLSLKQKHQQRKKMMKVGLHLRKLT